MMRTKWMAFLLLAGCVPLMPKTIGRELELSVYPQIAPKTQAILNPNTLSSIATLDIIPYIYDSGAYKPISSVTGNPTTPGAVDMLKLTQASPTIDPSRPFVIRHLKPNKDYRVRAQAYSQANALISEDSTSYVDVSVGNNDAPPAANLPVKLLSTPFAASTSIQINTEGRYDCLKSTLYLVAGGSQVALTQTTRSNPEMIFNNLQGATDYRLLVEAYKLETMLASTSLTFNPGNETQPATQSVNLTIPYVVKLVAGSGTAAFADAIGAAASFAQPHGGALDNFGNLYVGDHSNHRIRKVVLATGAVSTLAGNGTAAWTDGTGANANFWSPVGVAYDEQGFLYIGDTGNARLRKVVLSTGAVSTIAGNSVGYAEGNGTSARFSAPRGVELDGLGNLYIADAGNHRIRKIVLSTGAVSTVVGNGNAAWVDGNGTSASINCAEGLALDNMGNLYIADTYNHLIRKVVLATGNVTTLAGNGTAALTDGTGTKAQFYHPVSIVCDKQGNLFVGDFHNNSIRKVTPSGVVTTIAGNGVLGTTDGTGTMAKFANPEEVVMDPQGILYVMEFSSSNIRKVE